ncbi:MAG: PPOX class F420-dependent oxidoreductase [Pseudomonadota bacterium]
MGSKFAAIERGTYLSLATRQRGGGWVTTSIWFAPEGDSFYTFSTRKASRVKRVLNFSECRVASCNVIGRITGDWIDARAYVLAMPADKRVALAALHRKYGWKMHLADLVSQLTGKMKRRAYIRIDPIHVTLNK